MLRQISAKQTPTIRAVIKCGDLWLDKARDLATQEELDAEFAAATSPPFPISLTVYRQEKGTKNAAPVEGFINLPVPDAAFISDEERTAKGLNFNFRHKPDARAFSEIGVYWFVYTVYAKNGAPIQITAGVNVTNV